MRLVTDHIVPGADNTLQIEATGEPNFAGAQNRYVVTGFNTNGNDARQPYDPFEQLVLLFQNGNPVVTGINGITMEVLLAVVADRLNGFQQGQFACDENAVALSHVQEALNALGDRTRKYLNPLPDLDGA